MLQVQVDHLAVQRARIGEDHRDPLARVLAMSGYTGEMAPHQLLSAGARRFLPKPFTPQELLHAVQAVLDEPDSNV